MLVNLQRPLERIQSLVRITVYPVTPCEGRQTGGDVFAPRVQDLLAYLQRLHEQRLSRRAVASRQGDDAEVVDDRGGKGGLFAPLLPVFFEGLTGSGFRVPLITPR